MKAKKRPSAVGPGSVAKLELAGVVWIRGAAAGRRKKKTAEQEGTEETESV
jgi:hypothetical protein